MGRADLDFSISVFAQSLFIFGASRSLGSAELVGRCPRPPAPHYWRCALSFFFFRFTIVCYHYNARLRILQPTHRRQAKYYIFVRVLPACFSSRKTNKVLTCKIGFVYSDCALRIRGESEQALIAEFRDLLRKP